MLARQGSAPRSAPPSGLTTEWPSSLPSRSRSATPIAPGTRATDPPSHAHHHDRVLELTPQDHVLDRVAAEELRAGRRVDDDRRSCRLGALCCRFSPPDGPTRSPDPAGAERSLAAVVVRCRIADTFRCDTDDPGHKAISRGRVGGASSVCLDPGSAPWIGWGHREEDTWTANWLRSSHSCSAATWAT